MTSGEPRLRPELRVARDGDTVTITVAGVVLGLTPEQARALAAMLVGAAR